VGPRPSLDDTVQKKARSSGKNSSPTSLDTTRTTENDVSNNFSIVVCIFVTAVTFLQSRCLATIDFYRAVA
jgi:hypothetical protein